jgi:hypothetical protein
MKRLGAALALVFTTLAGPLKAQPQRHGEYQVKAAFLFNFGKFINTRNAQSDLFSICVIGEDPFGSNLDGAVEGGTVGGKPAVARRISVPEAARDCEILFISASEDNRLNAILDAVAKTAVLTVSDIPRFAQRGGMIGFLFDGNRVRFEVNLGPATATGLTLSSELLRVASAVRAR